MSQGKVYLVGAGPGDIGLITLKGYQLVCKADVLLYDHLIPSELPRLTKPGCELISVGKFASKHTLPQEGINDLLVEKAQTNETIVRLKGGDCYLFGRGGEEAEACLEAGVEFEVVPGVTSALAAPCYGGIPPTHRDYTSNVAIVTGHRREEKELDIPKAGTVIFLMGVKNIQKIIDKLQEQGWASDTKIAAIEHGTWYDQRVITGTLTDFIEKIAEANLRTPAIFIVGKVVELYEKLDWFGKKANVLVMGNHPERYEHLGNIVHRRIIDCVAVDDYSQADEILKDVAAYDWIVFTSVNGAKYMFDRLYEMGMDARSLALSKIAAIGQTTADRLKDYGIIADLVPPVESSKGLVGEFEKIDITGKKVLLPTAEVSSKELPEGLQGMGADVEKATVYKTVDVDPGEIEFDFIDQILFTSGSTVRAFVRKFSKVPEHIKCYGLGPPTVAEAQKNGIDAEVLPSSNK